MQATPSTSGHAPGMNGAAPAAKPKRTFKKRKKGQVCSGDPPRNYVYGAKRPRENADLVHAQLRLARHYSNDLVKVEQQRRADRAQARTRLCPGLAEAEAAVEAAQAALDAAQAALAAQNQRRGKKHSASRAQRAEVKRLKADLAAARAVRKGISRDGGPALKDAYKEIAEATVERGKKAYAASDAATGTRGAIRQGMAMIVKAEDPRFRRFDGGGLLAVQLVNGMTVGALFAGRSTQARISKAPPGPRTVPGSRGDRTRHYLHLRIASEEPEGAKLTKNGHRRGGGPIWTTVMFTMHRPLPEDCLVKWVYLIHRKVACTSEWSVMFSVTRKEWPRERAAAGLFAVDLGWRRRPDGGLRVARWAAADGTEEEVVIPAERLRRWEYADQLESKRKHAFNAAMERLRDWLRSAPVALPEWLAEIRAHAHLWKAQRRLAVLTIRWRTSRFAGDEAIFAAMEEWRCADRRAYEEARHTVRKQIRWRNNFYRVFAKAMAARYHACAFEDIDWKAAQKRPDVEAPADISRTNAKVAAVATLRRFCKEACAAMLLLRPEYTTQTCHACQKVTPFADKAALVHTCVHCRRTWDRDVNAARNLLRLGVEAALAQGLPLGEVVRPEDRDDAPAGGEVPW